MMKKFLLTTTTLVTAVAAGFMPGMNSAHADVIYVDATTANTGPSGFSSATGATEWRFRADFGTSLGNDGVFEGQRNSGQGETGDPEITTTFTIASAGTYDIYVFYVAPPAAGAANNWAIRAGLSSNPNANPIYDKDGLLGTAGTLASTLTFSGDDPVATNQNATYVHYYAVIGQATVTDGGSVSVYIDDIPTNQNSGTDRTWYDGVGYAVVPEPGSLALLGLGGLLVGARRRRD